MTIEEQLLQLIKEKEFADREVFKLRIENARLNKQLDWIYIEMSKLREMLGRKSRIEFVEVGKVI